MPWFMPVVRCVAALVVLTDLLHTFTGVGPGVFLESLRCCLPYMDGVRQWLPIIWCWRALPQRGRSVLCGVMLLICVAQPVAAASDGGNGGPPHDVQVVAETITACALALSLIIRGRQDHLTAQLKFPCTQQRVFGFYRYAV
jgi:hypothetical protein